MLRLPSAGGDSSLSGTEQSALDHHAPPTEAWVAPLQSAPMQSITPHQLSIFVEKVNNAFADVQRKRDSDRRLADRSFQQLQQKVDGVSDDRARDADARKKVAEVQGSVTGLLEELQNVARRVDGVEKSVWARTSGLDAVKQRSQELEQQVQNLEQHSRLAESSKEEVRKREVARLRRVERTIEDLSRRFSKTEESLQSQPRENITNLRSRRLEESQQLKDAEELKQRLHWLEEEITGELRQRVAWLEETHSSHGAPPLQHGREAAQNEEAICELTEQLSHLQQRSSCSDQALVALQQQVQHFSSGDLRDHHGQEASLPRTVVALQAELGVMSQQFSELNARFVELEGTLDGDLEGTPRRPSGTSNAGRGHADLQPQLDEITRELDQVRQWLMALQHHQQLSDSGGQRAGSDAGGSEVTSPSRGRGGRQEHLASEMQESGRSAAEALDILEERLGKLEESTDLYLSYTKCLASDQSQQMEQFGRRLEDVESSNKAVEQLLHEVEDADPSGPRSIVEQLDDVREQVAELRCGFSPRSPGQQRPPGDLHERRQMPNEDEVIERLSAVEERVHDHAELAASQIEKILERVSEDLAYHRHDLEDARQEARASVSALSDQVFAIGGQTQQSLSLTSNGALGSTIAAFTKKFKLQADSLEVMDQEELEHVEAALQHMQGTCLDAADQIAHAVQSELRALCGQDQHLQRTALSGSATPPSPVEDDRSSTSSADDGGLKGRLLSDHQWAKS